MGGLKIDVQRLREPYLCCLQGKQKSKRVCIVWYIPFLSAILWGYPRYSAGG